jgi:hypothetical protein
VCVCVVTLDKFIFIFQRQTNPLLIRVDVRAGHGAGKPTAKIVCFCLFVCFSFISFIIPDRRINGSLFVFSSCIGFEMA